MKIAAKIKNVSGGVITPPILPPTEPVTPSNPSTRKTTIKITYAELPANTDLKFADFPLFVDRAIIGINDDNGAGVNDIYAVLNGGVDTLGVTHSGFTQDDGTGNRIPLEYTFAVCYSSVGRNNTYVTKEQLINMINSGSISVSNHTWEHTATNPEYQLSQNQTSIYNNVNGYYCSTVTEPGGERGLVPELVKKPYMAYFSEGFGSGAVNNEGLPTHFRSRMTLTEVNKHPLLQLCTRWNADPKQGEAGTGWVAGTPKSNAEIDLFVSEQMQSGEKTIFSLFSHGGGGADTTHFKSFITRLRNHPQAGPIALLKADRVFNWFALKATAAITKSISGKEITYVIDCTNMPLYAEVLSTYLTLPDGEILGARISGVQAANINFETKRLVTYKENNKPEREVFYGTPGLTVEGFMQSEMDIPGDLTSLQAPAFPILHTVWNATNETGQPAYFYGAMRNPAQVVWTPRPEQNLLLSKFVFGAYNGNYEGRGITIDGEKEDGTLVRLVDFPGNTPRINETYTYDFAPYPYKRFINTVRSNGYPNFIHPYGKYTPTPKPVIPEQTKYRIGNHTGVNFHSFSINQGLNDVNNRDDVEPQTFEILKRIKNGRFYKDWSNIENIKGDFRWNKDYQGYGTDIILQRCFENNIELVVCLKEMPEYLMDTYPNYQKRDSEGRLLWLDNNNNETLDSTITGRKQVVNGNREKVPIAYGKDRLTEEAYAEIEELAFQFTARYGRNKNIPRDRVKAREGYFYPNAPQAGSWTKEIGLGWVKFLEVWNEIEKTWKEDESYISPREYAVMAHCIWRGVKAADPTMQVVNAGLAYFRPDWLREAHYWSMKLYGFWPFDELQYHSYPNTADSEQHSGKPSQGMAIEQSNIKTELVPNWTRVNSLYMGNLPWGNGEMGIDSDPRSPLHGVLPEGSTDTLENWIGNLHTRMALFQAEAGAIRTNFYDFKNNDDPNTHYIQFATMGFMKTEGTYPNLTVVPYAKAYQLGQLNALAGDYIFQNRITNEKDFNNNVWKTPDGKLMETYYWETEINKSSEKFITAGPNGIRAIKFSNSAWEPTNVVDYPEGVHKFTIDEYPLFIFRK